jgi:S-layer protein
MAYNLTQLTTFFTNANAGTAPTAAQLTGLQSIANQNATGTLSDAQALQSAIDLGSDITTAVSIQSYQFFLGFAPSVAGLKALNAAYVGSGAQAGLNGENRFIAQAVSLALQNPTAKASFTAAYGSSSVADATAAAYNVIIGNAAAAAAGVNVANAVAFLSSAASVAYYEAFVKANVPGLAAADVALAVKAAIVGEIIYQATIFNNGAGLGSYATAANNLVKDLADDGALTADNASGIALFDNYGVTPVAQTLTLTTAADTLNGAAGADTFVATNTTLSAADSLTGGAGVDTLNYASNGNAAVNQAGFKAAGIEVYNITSDAVGGTTFDMSGVTGATRVVNDDSSFDLTVNGLNEAATIVVRNTSQSTATVNTTVNYNAAVTNGATTTQALVLENVFDPAQPAGTASKSAVTVNGVEIFNITGSGSATSNLTALNSTTLTTVNIDGGQGVKIDALTFAGTTGTVDGSKNTGGINVTLTNSGAADVAVTGGTGNDRADFSNGFAAKDSFTGGTGIDTLVVSNAVATGAAGGTLSGVEVLEVSGGGTGTVDLSKFAGVTDVVYTSTHVGSAGNSLAGATVVSKAGATSTITADVGAVAQNLTVSVATDGAADATTINLNKVGAADAMGTITVTDIETLTLNIADDTTVAGTGVLTLAGVSGNKVSKVNVTSNADVTITGAVGGAALTSFDLSAATGKATLTGGITTALTGATIKLGAGDDQVTVTATTGTATGGDTITLGAGKDTVTYTAVGQSGDKTTDTITDFVSGTDKLNLTALGLNSSTLFLGARANFGLAQGALTSTAGQAVFQADTNTLWIDNGNGQLDASDFRIILTGVSTLTAADLSLGSGAAVTLSAAAATVNGTTKTNANASTTNENDTISATNVTIANSTIDGLLGTDTLTISGNAQPITSLTTASATGAAITNVENITFTGVDGVMNIGNNFANTVKNITLSSANAGLTATTTAASQTIVVSNTTGANASTITNAHTGTSITLGSAGDTINTTVAALAGSTFAMGAGADTLNVTDAGTFTLAATAVAGGAAGWSGVETLNLTGASTVTVTPDAALTINQGAGATSITGTGQTITVAANGTNALTLAGTSAYVVTGGAANTITSTGTGALTVTATNNAQTVVSASATTVNLAAQGGTETLGGAGAFTVTGLGTVANGVVTEQAGRTGALTVTTAGTNGGTVTEVAGATGAVTLNHAGTGTLTVTTVASHGVTTINATAANTVTVSGDGTISYTATGAGNHTITSTTTGAAGDVIVASTTAGVVDTITAGAGADKITISGGNDVLVLAAPTSDTGIASGFTASAAVPANNQQINVAAMDVVTGFSAGATISLTGVTGSGAALIRNGGTLGAGNAGDAVLLTGDYNSTTGIFTVNTAGTSSLFVYDDNGTTAGGNYRGVVLVGYIDAGGADTWTAGPAAVFTGVA